MAAARLDTVAVDAQGGCHEAVITMDPFWAVEIFRKADGQSLGPLSLSCAFPWGQDAIYLFDSLSRDQPPLGSSPAPVTELLLFPPVVPLRWQPAGFQALTASEWEALVITKLVDRPATCASVPLCLPGDAPSWAEEDGSTDGDRGAIDDALMMGDSSSDEEEGDIPEELPGVEDDDGDDNGGSSYGEGSDG